MVSHDVTQIKLYHRYDIYSSPEKWAWTRRRQELTARMSAHTHMITVEKLEHNKSDGRATEVLFGYLCIHLNPCMLEWFDIKFSLNSKVHPPQAPRARITI